MAQTDHARNSYFISLCTDTSLEVARSKRFKTVAVDGINHLASLISDHRFWSPIVWRDGHNRKSNFMGAYYLVMDLDDGALSVEQVKDKLTAAGYAALIYTTQSHQKVKSGNAPCDRFRFVIPFASPVTELVVYEHNARLWAKGYFADVACTSGSTCFKPALAGVEVIEGDRLVEIRRVPPRSPRPDPYQGSRQVPPWINAKLAFGVPAGSRHREIFSIAANLAKCGFSEGETIGFITNSVLREAEDDGGQRTARDGWRAGQNQA